MHSTIAVEWLLIMLDLGQTVSDVRLEKGVFYASQGDVGVAFCRFWCTRSWPRTPCFLTIKWQKYGAHMHSISETPNTSPVSSTVYVFWNPNKK